jgi:hypothetical protein
MTRGALLFALLAMSMALAPGCRHAAFWPRAVAQCPGSLRPTSEIEGDLRVELRMQVKAESVDAALRLALEKQGDELTLVGISPLGAVVFSVIQNGVELEVDALPASILEVPPENVLRDLHRILFLDVPEGSTDGKRRASLGGVQITELWRAGRLVRRSFAGDGAPVVVDFVEAPLEGLSEARVRNPGCGTSSTVVTLRSSAVE